MNDNLVRTLPAAVDIIIIGGGIIGASVAYHLAQRGATHVALLERRQLTCGTTWHAAGLVGQLRATQNLTKLAKYTAELYADLERATGQATGFKQTGSLAVAASAARFEELQRGASMARGFGLEVSMLTPAEAQALWPLLSIEGVVGAAYLPKDGQTNPVDTTQALARGAKSRGVKIFENCRVSAIRTERGCVTGVDTDLGAIRAKVVVNCGGMWARDIGDWVDASIPLHAAEHFYIVTEPVPDLQRGLPVLRDSDGCSYFKEDAGKLLVGWFEPRAKPWAMKGIPESFCFDQLPEDLAHIEPLLEAAARRVPRLAEVGLQVLFNGPESFTPDDRYLLGETPEVRGLYVAAGFNSIGIQSAGGAGKVLADWIVDGHAPMDLWDVDIRRCMPFQRNKRYLHDRTIESLGLLYAMHWPHRQAETARGVRRSALHDGIAARGACFGEVAGFERPNFFAPEGSAAVYEYSYGRQNWFPHAAAEHLAVRENVGIFDQSSFAKFLVEGRDAEAELNRICAADVAVAPGRIVYTQWLNARGGIEADLTVTREDENRYLVVTACATQNRDFAWLRGQLSPHARVNAVDVSSGIAVLGVMGPASRVFLSALTDADLSNAAFPFGTSKVIDLGYARVRASRISYVGELGWELYIGAEYAASVFEFLIAAGKRFGARLAGYHAMNSLRLEKSYRHWGHDITDEDSPIDSGLGFAVGWKKSVDFTGRKALELQKSTGRPRRLVTFAVQAVDRVIHHNEPIWRDEVIVGRVTSGMYGHTVGKQVALGYVETPEGGITNEWIEQGRYEIEIAQIRTPAVPSLRPLYDPTSARMRV